MSTKGWNSLKPITTPDQMPAPIHWNLMNEDWKMRLTKSQIYNTSSGFDTQTLDAMVNNPRLKSRACISESTL